MSPLASAVLSILSGGLVVFIIMGISGIIKDFSIKSPLLELSSSLKEKIQDVKQDLSESKKEINEKISILSNNIQSINSRIDNTNFNISNSEVRARLRSDSYSSSNIHNDFRGIIKDISEMLGDTLESKGKEHAFRWNSLDKELKTATEAQEKIQKIMKDIPYNELDNKQIIDYGLLKLLENKYDDALGVFERVLEKDPNNVCALTNKANALINLGKYDEAISCLKKALEIDRKFYPIFINLGNALLLQNKNEEAIEYYDKALEINRVSVEALNNKAKALVAIGKVEEAHKIVNEAIKLNSKLKEIWKL